MSQASGSLGRALACLFVGPILAIPDEEWRFRFSVSVEYPEHFTFTATTHDGRSVMLTKFPGVEEYMDGYTELQDAFRLLINGLVPGGRIGNRTSIKRQYDALERRLRRRLNAFTEFEKRKAREEKEATGTTGSNNPPPTPEPMAGSGFSDTP
jgi:hypothetical protein